ncbi:hypothetical protein Tco_0561821 [Tanacetum coccineum]
MVSRDLGGLDVGSLRGKNLSLLGKWRWRFLMEKDAMWRKVLVNCEWGGCWSWRVEPHGRSASEFDALLSAINGLSLSLGDHDEWKWSLNANGTFSVNILSKMIDKQQFSSRIPHLSNFDKRDIDVHSLLCPLCENEVDVRLSKS